MNSEVLEGIGPRLAAAREAKGMATAEVAAKLRLGVRQIEALEADAYEQLPGEVFVRGFIRNYARLLDLDPDALLPTQEVVVSEQLTVPSTNLRFQPSPIQRWLLLPVGSAILFFALVALLYAWLSSGEQGAVEQPAQEMVPGPQASQIVAPQPVILDQSQTAPAAANPEATAEADVPATGVTGTSPTSAPQPNMPVPANKPSVIDAAKPVLPPLPVAPVKTPTEAAKPQPAVAVKSPLATAPAAKPAAPAAIPASKPVQAAPEPAKPTVPAATAPAAKPVASRSLVFQPAEDSWVQVVDAKGQRFSKLLRAGSTETLEGTPPFRLVVGNAATMKLSHNGKPVDLKPFIGEKVARLKLGDEGASKLNPPASKPADGQGQ
ncbi:MAG: helix-turn-helix domain-containing protein [Hydrogenophilaceae bacterium]|nr:helix-turn-helix domain-containing protein [Hydrogenophilaceae bacterium]